SFGSRPDPLRVWAVDLPREASPLLQPIVEPALPAHHLTKAMVMSKTTMHALSDPISQKDGKYLYAIIGNGHNRSYDVAGIDGNTVYSVTHGRIAALESDCSRNKIRPERSHLAAH